MTTGRLLAKALVAGSLLTAGPVFAADVTPERLVNADREPQNWLMNHRTYDAQRYSPLDKINKSNVKSLKLAYAPPMTFEAGGRQYVAIQSGLNRNARNINACVARRPRVG